MTRTGALSNSQILRAAMVVLLGFMASGVLGLVRYAVISAVFGAGADLDAFYAAQQIPEALFVIVAGGALGSSFIPVFARFLSDDADADNTQAWQLASSVMTLAALAASVLAVLIVLLAPLLVPALLVPGSDPAEQTLTTELVQLMLVTTVIFSVSGLIMGILNAHQNFLFPALALSMNNIGIIIGALVIAPVLGTADDPSIYGLAWGAILGALLHLMVQLPGLVQIRARLRVLLSWRTEGVREVLLLMGPRVLGLAVVQINFVVNIAFASAMVDGSQTALRTAWALMFFVLGVVAQSVGTAVFPTLSRLAADGDMAGYRDRLSTVMRALLFVALPASIGLIVTAEPLVATMLERGEWGREDTLATAWALSFFALGIAGHSLLEVLSRAFYALSDTWTPVWVGILAMASNIALSVIFIQFVGNPDSLTQGPFAGLALANSLTTLLEAAFLWWLLSRRIDGVNDRQIMIGAGRALVAALIMGAVVWGIGGVVRDAGSLVWLVASGVSGVIVFFGLAVVLRIEETTILLRRFRLVRR